MRIFNSCLTSIKLIWGNLHVAGQLFTYGIFGCLIGVVVGAFEVLVDVVGTVIGFVLALPIAIVEFLLRVLFGKF